MTLVTRQARPWILALPTTYCLVTLLGCTAALENPEAFSDRAPPGAGASSAGAAGSPAASAGAGGAASAGASGGAPQAGAGAAVGGSGGSVAQGGGGGSGGVPACVAALFVNGSGKCASGACHGKSSSPAAELDLASAGVELRLVDQIAGHKGLDAGAVCSKTDKLIDTTDPNKSWLLKKITGQQGNCGVRMPFGQTLAADELTCLQNWIQSY